MSAVTAAGLAADPGVLTRDALLDPLVFAGACARATGASIDGCKRLRARYQVGRSLRVLYELAVDGRRVLVAARTFHDDVARVAGRAREDALATPPLPPVIELAELGAVAWVYPNDRKLRGLHDIEATVSSLLDRPVRVELVRWGPEKSATLRCDADAETLGYAKTYAEASTTVERQHHEALRAQLEGGAPLRLPRVLATNASVILLEAVAGVPLAEIDEAEVGGAYGRYARALATLHSLTPPPGAPRFARLDEERILAAAELIGRVRPDVAAAAARLAQKLADDPPGLSRRACLHGDAHPKNALDDGETTALVDLEQLAVGDPAAEVGSVLAALDYRAVAEGVKGVETWRQSFLNAYGSPRESVLARHRAAAILVERAFRAVTRIREQGLAALPALLRRAESVLAGETS